MILRPTARFVAFIMLAAGCAAPGANPVGEPAYLVRYEPGEGSSNPRHIELISGDEEYRSEEGPTMLARMFSNHHGFRCTVLFAVDPKAGIVNPTVNTTIPRTENLDDADLMFIQTRWRLLPDEQMAPLDRYLKAGKLVIGIRTVTHALTPSTELHRQVLAYLRQYRQAEDSGPVELPDIAPDA